MAGEGEVRSEDGIEEALGAKGLKSKVGKEEGERTQEIGKREEEAERAHSEGSTKSDCSKSTIVWLRLLNECSNLAISLQFSITPCNLSLSFAVAAASEVC